MECEQVKLIFRFQFQQQVPKGLQVTNRSAFKTQNIGQPFLKMTAPLKKTLTKQNNYFCLILEVYSSSNEILKKSVIRVLDKVVQKSAVSQPHLSDKPEN